MTTIFKPIPGRSITDPESGLGADVINDAGIKRLAVTGTSTISGTVTTISAPPTDRRFQRFTVTGTAQPLVFAGFLIKGISVKADQGNNGRIRLGESDLVSTDDYTILEPGEVYSAEINGTLNPIYVAFDTGTTSAFVYVAALGDPV
jgi:hypothetical protein